MVRQNCRATFLLAAVFLAGNMHSANAATTPKPQPHQYMRVFYYREGKHARTSFLGNLGSIDVLAPQSYSLNNDGTLEGRVKEDILAFAKNSHIKVMPLVTNKAFDRDAGHALLDDPVKQDAAIGVLIAEAQNKNYWGWQFDFEQMDASYRDKYSAFIKKAGEALKKNNLVASVAVVAQVSENPDDYPKDLWQHLIGAYDYPSLASSTDFVSVMAYDDPDSKGPVTRYSWLKRVIEHSLKSIPSEKLSLGIPLYYWKWNDSEAKLVDIGGYQGIQNVLKKYRVTRGYSTQEQAPFIQYAHKKIHYTIWYENARSVKKKLELVTTYHLHGFSAWVLGLEVPNVHDVIQKP